VNKTHACYYSYNTSIVYQLPLKSATEIQKYI